MGSFCKGSLLQSLASYKDWVKWALSEDVAKNYLAQSTGFRWGESLCFSAGSYKRKLIANYITLSD